MTTTPTTKQNSRKSLLGTYKLPTSLTAVGIIAVHDATTRRFLMEGLSAIGIGAVVLNEGESRLPGIAFRASLSPTDLSGFDFFVYDNEHDGVDVVTYMKNGIVPIMPEDNVFSGLLKTFNPMKFEGNGFFYKKTNPFCIFEKVVAYLENSRFPEDKRVLLKNVSGTF